ncbi:DUF1266 domain-containing protein [Paenibacillus sp. NPDC058174]|uniref:DUF1266 domain-containing protein n=1 Tax=Paenibacillus sp. NPDC058174 TaxID=3346366 RepID=UPI0036DB63E2
MTAAYGSSKDLEGLCSVKDLWKKVGNKDYQLTPELLHGMPVYNRLEQAGVKEEVEIYLRSSFQVHNAVNLREKLEALLIGSECVLQFLEIRKAITAMPYRERVRKLQAMKDDEQEAALYEIVMQYDLALPEAGILGFDIATYVSLCRLGAFMGYIDETEVFKRLETSTSMARQHFSSFEQYALSSAVGVLFSNDNVNKEEVLNNYYSSLHHPYSYWRHLEWAQ